MKNLKIYEEFKKSEINVGDYVIVDIKDIDRFFGSFTQVVKFKEFLFENIGKVIGEYRSYSGEKIYMVKYNNVTTFINHYFRANNTIDVGNEDIFAVGTIDELKQTYEIIKNAKKFNI